MKMTLREIHGTDKIKPITRRKALAEQRAGIAFALQNP